MSLRCIGRFLLNASRRGLEIVPLISYYSNAALFEVGEVQCIVRVGRFRSFSKRSCKYARINLKKYVLDNVDVVVALAEWEGEVVQHIFPSESLMGLADEKGLIRLYIRPPVPRERPDMMGRLNYDEFRDAWKVFEPALEASVV